MVETYLRDGKVDTCGLTQDTKDTFAAWHSWWQKQPYQVTALEQKVVSKKYKFHGTFDGVLSDTIVDWKFSNSEDHFRILQLAGYAQAYFEQTGIRIKKGLIVQIDKQGEVHETHVPDVWKYVQLFIYLRRLWNFVKKIGKFKQKRKKHGPRRIKKAA